MYSGALQPYLNYRGVCMQGQGGQARIAPLHAQSRRTLSPGCRYRPGNDGNDGSQQASDDVVLAWQQRVRCGDSIQRLVVCWLRACEPYVGVVVRASGAQRIALAVLWIAEDEHGRPSTAPLLDSPLSFAVRISAQTPNPQPPPPPRRSPLAARCNCTTHTLARRIARRLLLRHSPLARLAWSCRPYLRLRCASRLASAGHDDSFTGPAVDECAGDSSRERTTVAHRPGP